MSYRSGLEVSVANMFEKLGVDFNYEETQVPYVIHHFYTPDFYIKATNIYLETKGFWRPEDRRKIKEIKKQLPDMDLRMVFQDPNKKISKQSKTTYGEWCDKHEIPWCKYTNIPIDWLANETIKGRLSP